MELASKLEEAHAKAIAREEEYPSEMYLALYEAQMLDSQIIERLMSPPTNTEQQRWK